MTDTRRTSAADRRARYGLAACVSVREAAILVGGDLEVARRWLYKAGVVRQGPTGERVFLCDLRDAMPVVAVPTRGRATLPDDQPTYTAASDL